MKTKIYASQFPEHMYWRWKNGWYISRLGYGTYRAGDEEATEALEIALAQGINLIDTAATYQGGAVASWLGRTLPGILQRTGVERAQIIMVSKIGAVQGEAWAWATPGTVTQIPGQSYGYCLDPAFLEQQLIVHLQALACETVDVVLLHNPEVLLQAGIPLARVYALIREAFNFLESQVRQGRLQYYGLGSQGLGEGRFNLGHLFNLADSVGGRGHRFRVVQLPLNVYETHGIAIVHQAQRLGMMVLTHRPLNVVQAQRGWQLAAPRLLREGDGPATVREEESLQVRRLRQQRLTAAEWGIVRARMSLGASSAQQLETTVRRRQQLYHQHLQALVGMAFPRCAGELSVSSQLLRVVMQALGPGSVLTGMHQPAYVQEACQVLATLPEPDPFRTFMRLSAQLKSLTPLKF